MTPTNPKVTAIQRAVSQRVRQHTNVAEAAEALVQALANAPGAEAHPGLDSETAWVIEERHARRVALIAALAEEARDKAAFSQAILDTLGRS